MTGWILKAGLELNSAGRGPSGRDLNNTTVLIYCTEFPFSCPIFTQKQDLEGKVLLK